MKPDDRLAKWMVILSIPLCLEHSITGCHKFGLPLLACIAIAALLVLVNIPLYYAIRRTTAQATALRLIFCSLIFFSFAPQNLSLILNYPKIAIPLAIVISIWIAFHRPLKPTLHDLDA